MKKTIILLLFCVMLCVSSPAQQRQAKNLQKPKVLFILADDLGYHDLSCMGSKYYETPHVDRIAHEGMVFTNGYAACQVCSPSRASLMTGKFPARHGITDWIGALAGEDWRKVGRFNKLLPADYVHQLQHDDITLPEAMKEAGYLTFFAGKWHLGDKGSWPEDHGFDVNKGGWDKGSPMGGYFSPWENPKLPNGPDGESLTLRLARETADFIKENKDTSFFAFLSFYAVHSPLQTSQEKWHKYQQKARGMGIANTGFKMERFLPVRQVQDNPVYAGMVQTMDEAVGIVLKALEDNGLSESTIVVFTSDNGGVSAGDGFATANLPLRGGKGYQFEGGIREPFLIKVPWLDCAGKKSHEPVTGTDFYPTLLDLIGADLKPEEHNDGLSLVPLFNGGRIKERPLIWHYPHYGNQGGEPSSVIRLGDWKLIHYYEDGREELYNLTSDPGEMYNLSASNPERVNMLHHKLFGYLNDVHARFPLKDTEYQPKLERQHQETVVNELWPKLEKQRLKMLSDDYQPNQNWWGSQPKKRGK